LRHLPGDPDRVVERQDGDGGAQAQAPGAGRVAGQEDQRRRVVGAASAMALFEPDGVEAQRLGQLDLAQRGGVKGRVLDGNQAESHSASITYLDIADNRPGHEEPLSPLKILKALKRFLNITTNEAYHFSASCSRLLQYLFTGRGSEYIYHLPTVSTQYDHPPYSSCGDRCNK